jgi:hypothetical protein
MTIYKAFLDYGWHNGTYTVGYFYSITGAYDAIQEDAKNSKFELDDPVENPWGTTYRVLDRVDYEYVIRSVEVQP